MIYLDTSVALAWLLAEDRRPPATLWANTLSSSRLLEYEVWTWLYSRGLADSHGGAARSLIGRLALLELAPPVLARALEPFPTATPVRTLDALHLASCEYLRGLGQTVTLASYDRRITAVARAMEISIYEPEGA